MIRQQLQQHGVRNLAVEDDDRLDAGLALFFMAVVVIVIAASAREWVLIATKRKAPVVHEGPYVKSRFDPVEG